MIGSPPRIGYAYETEQQDYKLPVKYVQPQSLNMVYSRYTDPSGLVSQSRIKFGQVLKRFESCPFLNVRELVVAFATLNPHAPVASHDWQSNLLLEQYSYQPQLEQADKLISNTINLHRQELLCLERLETVVGELLQLQSSFVRDTQACKGRFQAFERMTAEEIAKGSSRHAYQQENLTVKKLISNYFELQHFREWAHKAFGEIKRLGFTNEPTRDAVDLASLLSMIHQGQKELQDRTQFLEAKREGMRRNIGLALAPVSEAELAIEVPVNGIQLYWLYNMLSNIRQPDPNLRVLYEYLRDGYDRYLKKLRDVLHILKLIELEPNYREIVLREQRRLTQHLKKHYQLLVPYQQSPEFIQANTNLSRVGYTSQLFARELLDFRKATLFVNSTYETLFKSICDSQSFSSSAAALIGAHVNQFSQADTSQGYNIILLETLRRLELLNNSSR